MENYIIWITTTGTSVSLISPGGPKDKERVLFLFTQYLACSKSEQILIDDCLEEKPMKYLEENAFVFAFFALSHCCTGFAWSHCALKTQMRSSEMRLIHDSFILNLFCPSPPCCPRGTSILALFKALEYRDE